MRIIIRHSKRPGKGVQPAGFSAAMVNGERETIFQGMGGSADPNVFSAQGLVNCLQVALDEANDKEQKDSKGHVEVVGAPKGLSDLKGYVYKWLDELRRERPNVTLGLHLDDQVLGELSNRHNAAKPLVRLMAYETRVDLEYKNEPNASDKDLLKLLTVIAQKAAEEASSRGFGDKDEMSDFHEVQIDKL